MLASATHDTKRGEDARAQARRPVGTAGGMARGRSRPGAGSCAPAAAISKAARRPTATTNTCSTRCWSALAGRNARRARPTEALTAYRRAHPQGAGQSRCARPSCHSSWAAPNAVTKRRCMAFAPRSAAAGRARLLRCASCRSSADVARLGVAEQPGPDRAEADRAGRAGHLPGVRNCGISAWSIPTTGAPSTTPAASRRWRSSALNSRRRAPR